MPDYRVYGVLLRSDVAVPGFDGVEIESGSGDVPDVTVAFDDLVEGHRHVPGSWRAHPTLSDRRERDPNVIGVVVEERVEGGYLALEYSDGARFLIAEDGTSIVVLAPPGMTRESISTYLVNPVLALCLRRRGATSLHAAAVAVDGGATLFVGASGAGKSSLAYSLSRAPGCQVLCDDVSVLALTGTDVMVVPGHPRIRLWPWTVEGLLGDAEALPLISEDWSKRGADIADFAVDPVPVVAVCLLDGWSDQGLLVSQVPAPVALFSLLEHTYLAYLLDDEARTQDFKVLGDLVAAAPVFSVRRPRDLSSLGDASLALMAELRSATVN